MQAVILPAPQLLTPELLPKIPASLKVAEFILSSAPINPPSPFRWSRLANFISPPSPKKPRFYRPYSPQPVEQLPDPQTPPGVPESEPDDFIPNLADCEVRSEVGETEEPAPAVPEQPVRSWKIRNTRTQIVRTVTSRQLFRKTDQRPRRE
ncbi:Uncharacterized protein APZ42_001093 [Daphnia magna]|uniref:Uncharacterized protein n=1 Tax=Daphnia magna TaxID=35525 RepID=A0A164J6D8_9CRUS|nr:Uncharacterized protein APZ42_001093 [Daphnia magna]